MLNEPFPPSSMGYTRAIRQAPVNPCRNDNGNTSIDSARNSTVIFARQTDNIAPDNIKSTAMTCRIRQKFILFAMCALKQSCCVAIKEIIRQIITAIQQIPFGAVPNLNTSAFVESERL
jgi:hypothetical protein